MSNDMKNIFSVLFSLLFLSLSSITMAQTQPWMQIEDGVAGQDVSLLVSGLLENELVEGVLQRPTGEQIVIPMNADENGVLRTSLSGVHMRTAGEYVFELQRSYGGVFQEYISIEAGSVSPYRSEIKISKTTIPADGEAFSVLDVYAYDAYGNPVQGVLVKVISSRRDDVVSLQPQTDSFGHVTGKLFSKSPGLSVLSVLVDDEILADKEEVVFHLADKGLGNVGQGLGQFLKAQVFDEDDSFADLGYFDIEDFPEEVTVGQTLSVRAVARDQNGQTLKNYDGTIRFVSSDNKVELPADYTFVKEDQGVHQFFLAVRFGTPGEHSFSVHDLNNFEKKGSVNIRVLPKDGQDTGGSTPGKIQILTPEANGIYRSSRLTITGKAPGLSVVKIRAGVAQVVIEDLPVSEDGSFVYQTPTLADGIYEFTVLSIDETISSDPLRVTIDRTPPSNLAVEIVPPGPKKPNEPFTVRLASSEELSAASCVFDEASYDLVQQTESLYEVQMAAPARCGEFPLSCSISDTIGNKLEEPNAGVIQVLCGEDPQPPVQSNTAPTAPTNVSGQPGEHKVTLFWSPARDDKGVVQYRVSYVEEGSSVIETNIVPDNRTQWYVDGLTACTKYRFTVTAVDTDGVESVPSDVVSQGPTCDALPSAPKTADAGSDTPWLWMLLSLMIGGGVVALFRRA